MIKVLLFLVYLLNGEPKSEFKWFEEVTECMAFGQARIAQLTEQKVEGVAAGCYEVDEASQKTGV